jgi:hypothetical protein
MVTAVMIAWFRRDTERLRRDRAAASNSRNGPPKNNKPKKHTKYLETTGATNPERT